MQLIASVQKLRNAFIQDKLRFFLSLALKLSKKLPIASRVDQFLLKGLLILQENGDAFGVGCRGIFI